MFLCELLPKKLGAYEQWLSTLGRRLAAAGDELVVVFAGEPMPAVAAQMNQCGTRWHVLEGWEDADGRVRPWRMLGALSILRRERPAVVAVHFGDESTTMCLRLLHRVTSRERIKWVWHQHQQIRNPQGLAQRHASRIRLLSAIVDHVVVLYEGGLQSLILRHVQRDRITVIPNGIAPGCSPDARVKVRAALGVSLEAQIILNVSSLIPRKRVADSVAAFARAVGSPDNSGGHKNRDVRLLVVGTGPLEGDLRRLAEQLGVASRVEFLGRRDDVPGLLAASDVLMLTSQAEACPLAILEAMGAGKPVVATEAGAARELIVEGGTGYVAAVGDIATLASRLSALLNDEPLRKRMGAAGLERQRRLYNMDVAAQKHGELYRQLTGGAA